MRWSKSFIPTVKEDPQEAEALSHKLMVRAGLIRRLTAGAYTYLPMGFRALKKAERIIREELDAVGAVELLMPALQPVELWKKTGRYDVIGDVMIKFTNRHGKKVALGPTHEEVITDLVSGEIKSYKELPLILYQIQTKFRDELRPRFGVIRSCEFIMKDAYSFDIDAERMEQSYKKMYDAYCRIFERCGLPYVPVEADPGLMGGAVSHEFMIPSDIGEDRIVRCSSCGYSASTEIAAINKDNEKEENSEVQVDMKETLTSGKSTALEVSDFLKVELASILKTLIYMADGKPIAVLVRGDHEVNEAKIKNNLKVGTLTLASEEKVIEVTGGAMGFSGPVGLGLPIYADYSVGSMVNAVAGANTKDKHFIGINHGRDFAVDEWIDARVINSDDVCPKCGEGIEIATAIEIGHTFKLGTKYSDPLNVCVLDENGKERQVIMGCYGIGVNRILASLVETSHDENGIIWPTDLAPYEVVIIIVNKNDDHVTAEAEKLYAHFKEEGLDVLIDDRTQKSPGVKFKDADLIGFPVQVIVGKKSLDQEKVEVKDRRTGSSTLVGQDEVIDKVRDLLKIG
jgi:prolyl-tRNA synthetase